MFGLSIIQPWSWAILNAGKDIENRDWSTNIRGTIAIHSSKKYDAGEYEWFQYFCSENGLDEANKLLPFNGKLTYGAILGTVELVDCVKSHNSPWFQGDYGFVLANPKPLITPIPWRGTLGFWRVPKEIEGQLKLL